MNQKYDNWSMLDLINLAYERGLTKVAEFYNATDLAKMHREYDIELVTRARRTRTRSKGALR